MVSGHWNVIVKLPLPSAVPDALEMEVTLVEQSPVVYPISIVLPLVKFVPITCTGAPAGAAPGMIATWGPGPGIGEANAGLEVPRARSIAPTTDHTATTATFRRSFRRDRPFSFSAVGFFFMGYPPPSTHVRLNRATRI